MRSTFSKLILIFAFFTACKKDEVKFEAVPSIEFTSITPASAQQYSDAVTITIKYKDGDGDLGENNSGAENCFITDNRIGIVYKYRIQQLAPDNANIAIQGTLNIPLGGQIITDSSNAQTVNYSLYITDRAGNRSNSVTTSVITIVK
jgi:hypothetical protein